MLTRSSRLLSGAFRNRSIQLGALRKVSDAAISSSANPADPTKKYQTPVTVDREFPDPFAEKKQNRKYFVAYGIGVTVACIIIFNYEKTTSPIVTSTLFFMRRSSIAKEQLGNGIDFASSWPWISGTLNTNKGDIDIAFKIKGDKGVGMLKLKAERELRMHPFNVHHFLLEMGGVDYDLTKDPAVEFDI
ncbi:DUF1783-domain-containing protein [Suhomyces tanzawaensis NRRL Y-17324]|uniref:DUF1783-domain-containing protein n=1 Tax=Suhomyces tanzawaensis NRRL Y-17324 TaxID=984487 RepID=A0A1E4SHL5_9ASCO|nr:DUF1783-domain-containing protein [Suhomyces tanzawaensis NRRL Y-17324]ODV79009.1 DUF1783-domain-containing protein [Suhomyces tanzawaensis NRRL Y-17324]